MKLEIGLLGAFTASSNGRKIQLHPGQAALVAYLALARGRQVPRTRVAGALWPDLPEDRARANLSTAVWRLRDALSRHGFLESIVRTSPDSCGLDPGVCELDVEQFLRGCIDSDGRHLTLEALGRATSALDLYRG
ncbi:MAG: winged helix-turn-helix domain-containing protein, partial [Bryobacteraceae bacterium]|nr:winged helix-turn-helix domain-containing protein [Bryobacteraceae bacterium]